MEHTVITDLYEASWLLINGCVLDEVECIKLSGKLACQFTFLGKRLTELRARYYDRDAVVNLFSFRQSYNQIHGLVHQAKKHYLDEAKVLSRQSAEVSETGGEG